MAVILISRGSLIGARQVAENVAERLGIPCLSRRLLLEAAEELGIDGAALGEELTKPPFLHERWSREREERLLHVRKVLLHRAVAGDFVYHGYASHLLVKDAPTVLRVRVLAPMETRIESVRAEEGLGREQALRHIHRIDRQRTKWARFLYGVDWHDPRLYDLVLNLEKMCVATAGSLLARLADDERFRSTAATRQELADLYLATRVQAELGLSRSAKLRITCHCGEVQIRGWVAFKERRAQIEEAARGVPGVERLDCEVDVGMRLSAG